MIRGIQEHRRLLHIKDAALKVDLAGDYETMEVDLQLHGSEMVLIHMQNPRQGSVLADACAGLIQPQRGTVQFLGKDWSTLPSDTENALRGRIGRVFTEGNWISHLTLLENILLPQLHHTRRSTEELCKEAGRLAEGFGLPGVPTGFPGMFPQTDLRIAACIRAFLGRLSLILLEDPTAEGHPEMVPNLVNAIRDARGSGAAVIWMITQEKIWRDRSIPVTGRYRLAGGKLMEVSR
jgi:phospholipid/cholesterol/gamma-HCH transport system ATP-binding protein